MVKKIVRRCAGIILAVILTLPFLPAASSAVSAETSDREVADSEIRPSGLYARYAVLMDADTGRVLFSKSGETEAPHGQYNEDHDLYYRSGKRKFI